MPNQQKIQKVEELRKKISNSKSVLFTEYHGLDANQTNDLRSKIKEVGAELSIAKNTLLKIAFKEEKKGNKDIDQQLSGPTAVIFSYEDAIAPIKVLTDFAKKIELPKIKAGILEGVFITTEKIEELSKIPSKEVLLAHAVSGLISPITGFVNVLGGTRSKLIYALSAITAEMEKEVS